MKSILIVSHGFLGDGILAGSFAENCKKNGYDLVDILVGFPQLIELLSNNPWIDNVYIDQIGSHPAVPGSLMKKNYETIYFTDHLVFNEKPIDTFNTKIQLKKLEYDFKLYVPEVELQKNNKPDLAFQLDWSARSYGPNNVSRDVNTIVNKLQEKYNVYFVGGDTHYNIDNDTPTTFLKHCALIQYCDVFFGYPGGMHWVAGGVNTPTICTSEHVVLHYTNNSEFKDNTFEEFCNQWMVHTSKHHIDQYHILLEPYISDNDIINYLTTDIYETILQSK
jgi:hypothetical protein